MSSQWMKVEPDYPTSFLFLGVDVIRDMFLIEYFLCLVTFEC